MLDYSRLLSSLLMMAFLATLLGASCTKTTITVTSTPGNPGTLQISGIGFVGANANARCAQVALVGLPPPESVVIPIGPQPICNGGTFSTTWTYANNAAGPCSPITVVVTASDTDPNTPVFGSQATQITACMPCGDLGLPACTGQRAPCFSGSLAPDGTCQCGARNEACCNGSVCAAGTDCLNGTCQCGGPNQRCCAGTGGGCGGNLSCVPGPENVPTCECGLNTLPCCDGTTCNPGMVCFPGSIRCTPCGEINGQPCCADNTCSASLTCANGTCQCGNLGQPCCNGSCNPQNNVTCNTTTNQCVQNGYPTPACQPLGATCGTSTGPLCCGDQVRCNYTHCTACLAHGKSCGQDDICCNLADACVANSNLSGQFVCDIPDSPPCGENYPPPCPPTLPTPGPQRKWHPASGKMRARPPGAKP